MIHYAEQAPDEALVAYVWSYWTFSVDAAFDGPYQHRIVPDGCVSLAYALEHPSEPGQLRIVGPRLKAFTIPVPAGAAYWGIRFRPGAASPLLHVPMEDLRDQVADAGQFLPELAQTLLNRLVPCTSREAMFEAFDAVLHPLIAQASPIDPHIRTAVDHITQTQGKGLIREVAEAVHLSPRQFQRRFRKAVGLTAKQFARIRRFRLSAGNILKTDPEAWGTIAASHGYADQAHLNRDFQQLTGLSPKSLAERIRTIDHKDVDP